jgi:hypothetical protein
MLNDLNLPRAAAAGTAMAIVAAVVFWFIATTISGDLVATAPGQSTPEPIPVGAMIPAVTLGGIAGFLIALALRKATSSPATTFVVVCLVALVPYGAYSFIQAEDISTGIWLNVLHIVAAIPIVGLVQRSLAAETAQ